MATEAPPVEVNGGSGSSGQALSDEDRKRIIRQIEFYFSDANLPTDRFMFLSTTPHLDATKAPTLSADAKAKAVTYGPGCNPILLSTICSFKRMRQYSSYYSLSSIAAALQSSATEPKLLEVYKDAENDQGTWMIRRIKPLEETTRAGASERSVYVKGFLPEPEEGGVADAPEPAGMQEKLEAWADEFGAVAALRMRRLDPRKAQKADADAIMADASASAQGEKANSAQKWKNSVFIEFFNVEDAKALVEAGQLEKGAAGKPTYEGRDLLVLSKVDYVTKKAQEKGFPVPELSKSGANAPSSPATTTPGSASRASGASGAGRRAPQFNAFRELQLVKSGAKTYVGQPDEKKTAKKAADAPPARITVEYDGKTYDVVKEGKSGKLKEGQEFTYPKGSVLAFELKGEAPSDFKEARVNFGKLKADLGEVGGPQCIFVDFTPGSTSGSVGFLSPLDAEAFEKVKAKGIQAGGREVEFTQPSEEQEKEYHEARLEHKVQQAVNPDGEKGSGGRGGRGGGRGGARGGRGGGRGGRGGGRAFDRNTEKSTSAAKPPSSGARKRDAEGNIIGGGADGASGDGPPDVASASKKTKIDVGEA